MSDQNDFRGKASDSPFSASDGDPSSAPAAASTSAPRPGHLKGEGIIQVQPLKRQEMQPAYAQDLGLGSVEHGFYGSMMNGLGSLAGAFGQLPCCVCCPNPWKQVRQGSVGLVSRFGQFYKAVDPGLVRVNPCSESLRTIDIKIQITMIPHQSVVTKDNVTVGVESVIYWHIVSPYKSAFGVSDIRLALIERAQTTLRHVVGSRTLQSLVSQREEVAAEIEEIVEAPAEKWGVAVESILIKDISFSKELQESLSSAAQQKRIGESKVIAAKAEVDSARLMRQAADILSSPAAMQIRQLEALQAMSRNAGAKVIFVPMSLDAMGKNALQGAAASGNDDLGEGTSSGGALDAKSLGAIQSMSQM